MTLRLRLPLGLRQPALGQYSTFLHSRHAYSWARNAFFFKTPLPTSGIRRRALWLIPVAGAVGFLLRPQPQNVLPRVLQDDAFIPCNRQAPRPQPIIYSPYEADQSIISRFVLSLRNTIFEPLVTAGRFVHLFCLFLPVILASPMLLVGAPAPELEGDRWGAVWWYDLLVMQMERAGPTFTKVPRSFHHQTDLMNFLCLSSPSGQDLELIFFHLCSVNVWDAFILRENPIPFCIPNEFLRRYSSARWIRYSRKLTKLQSELEQ